MSDGNNAALIRRAIEAIWNRCELDVADEVFAHDYVNHYGLIPDLLHGPEAVKFSVALYRRAFPGLHVSVEQLSTEAETVICHWTAWRQSADSTDGSPLSSDQRLLTGITRSRFAGGKVTESWTEWDGILEVHVSGPIPTGQTAELGRRARHEEPSRAGRQSPDD